MSRTPVEQFAERDGMTLRRVEYHGGGTCTKFFADKGGREFYGCWDAHEQFYWQPVGASDTGETTTPPKSAGNETEGG